MSSIDTLNEAIEALNNLKGAIKVNNGSLDVSLAVPQLYKVVDHLLEAVRLDRVERLEDKQG